MNIEGSEELAGLKSPQFDGLVHGSTGKESLVKGKC
jgi:hypothetical protein